MNQKRKLQVFLSSTFTDLTEERQAAVEAILTAGHIPAGMELFTIANESQMALVKRWIDESDVFVLILGGRYGSVDPKSGKSYTHLEFEYAIKTKKPLLIFVITENYLETKLKKFGSHVIEQKRTRQFEDFRSLVKNRVIKFWESADELKLSLLSSLIELNQRELRESPMLQVSTAHRVDDSIETNNLHLEILLSGNRIWNEWRSQNPDVKPQLKKVSVRHGNLRGADLSQIDLDNADFSGADLTGAILRNTSLVGAKFQDSNLEHADFNRADLNSANLTRANLQGTNLSESNLDNALLRKTNLIEANLSGASLHNTDFFASALSRTILCRTNFSTAHKLETVEHIGPSSIDTETLVASRNTIPSNFLRGCGVPEEFISWLPSLINQPIEYNSCFISYAHEDAEFARKLYTDLRQAGVTCWLDVHNLKPNEKIYEQIDQAIQVHDRLLLILSSSSVKSQWVELEIQAARKKEARFKRRVLFPIQLEDSIFAQSHQEFESIREYYITNFKGWREDPILYRKAFSKLLRDLVTTKAVEAKEKRI